MATNITVDEWMKSLEEATRDQGEHDSDVFTTQELGELWGLTATPTILRVRKAIKADLMVHTKKWVKGIDGVMRTTSAWKLLGKKGKQ